MRILYNSRKTQFKTPFGTVRTGQSCVLHIYLPKDCGATGVRLMLENCENEPVAEYAFSPESQAEAYEIYSLDFKPKDCGLYYYWFYVTKSDGGFRLFREGDGTNMEAGEKWQLSVIPEKFSVPDWARGAVMYQILPDRFYRSGECDLSEKLRPFRIHENWNDTPDFTPDAEGNWCGDFFGGNLNGIREKLPYLKSLGVGVIYCNPVFMAYSNHRYDTADYKRIDPMLGTEDDFRQLCESAHTLGIHIILDGVFSHTGSNSVYFDAKRIFGNGAVSSPDSPYRSWYRFHSYPNEYECWWNMPTLPNVEELSESYVNYIIEDDDSVIAHWLRLGADGFRLDVADELPDEFILRLKRRMREVKPDSLLIGEVWEDASNKRAYGISRRYFVDAELDSVMNYPWRTGIIRYVLGEDDGSALGEVISSLAENYPPQVLACLMNHLGTHDTPRILTALSGKTAPSAKEERAVSGLSPEERALAKERLCRASFVQYMLPGMPSIFYGDEAGAQGYEDPFCRRTFPWGAEDGDLTDFYRRLGRLKNESAALRFGDVRVTEAGKGRLCFTRQLENETAKIYVNQSDDILPIPDGTLRFGKGILLDGSRVLLPKNAFCALID